MPGSKPALRQSPTSAFVAGVFLLIGIGLIGAAAHEATWRWTGLRLLRSAEDRLTLYESTLEAAVERFRYLPQVIALTDPIRELLAAPQDEARIAAANAHLASVSRAAGADVLYVMNAAGLTLASSNSDEPTSFVGQHYDFRPYFQNAVRSGEGRYYAVGATTGKPGYFLASRIDGPSGPRGVAVVKVDLAPMETEWQRAREPVALIDGEGVVFLASDPGWRYRPLAPLGPEALRHLEETRQYGSPPQLGAHLTRGTVLTRGLPMVELAAQPGEDEAYFELRRAIPSHGWTLLHLVPAGDVQERARLAALLAMIASLAALFGLVAIRQRRAHARQRRQAHLELEQRVEARTQELATINRRLVGEIAERTRAEARLRAAQDGLVQSAKLAGLGQGLAGIAHEMAQPLAAMRTSLATLRHHIGGGDTARALTSTEDLAAITDRVAKLAGELRNFARPDREKPRPASLQAVVAGALSILEHRIRPAGVTLVQDFPEAPLLIQGRVNRLEQVVVNLIGNALDSIDDAARSGPGQRRIELSLHPLANTAELVVTDDGAGFGASLGEADIEQLFEPFVSTKAAGRGLGLGLSISRAIMREHGGDLRLEPGPGGGARAVMTLPLAPTPQEYPAQQDAR